MPPVLIDDVPAGFLKIAGQLDPFPSRQEQGVPIQPPSSDQRVQCCSLKRGVGRYLSHLWLVTQDSRVAFDHA
jgi:hypothetical protein